MRRLWVIVVAVATLVGVGWWLFAGKPQSPAPSNEIQATVPAPPAQLRRIDPKPPNVSPIGPAPAAERPGRIEGDVLGCADDDELLAPATLWFRSDAGLVDLESDLSGHFVATLPAGDWDLVGVVAEGCEGQEPELHFEVTPALRVENLRFNLYRNQPLLIQDIETRRPIEGARVEVRANALGLRSQRGPLPERSGSDGKLEARLFPGDDAWVVHSEFEEARASGDEFDLDDALNGSANVIRLVRRGGGGTVRFRLLDQNDGPVSGATVNGFAPRTGDAGAWSAWGTGALPTRYAGDGGYSVRVPSREWRLVVNAFAQPHDVDTRATSEQVIHVTRPVNAVTGRVFGAAGMEPVQSFTVTLSAFTKNEMSREVFQPEGRFSFSLTRGRWILSVEALGYLPYGKTIELADEDVDVQVPLLRGRTITGVVRDRLRKFAVAGVSVRAGNRWSQLGSTTTDRNGRFTLHGQPLEQLELHTSVYGYADYSVHVPADAGTVSIELAVTTSLRAEEWEGVGGILDFNDDAGFWFFDSFVPGSGAASAGLKDGDRILAIDGQGADRLTQAETVSKLRGPEGTIVHVTVMREGRMLQFDVVRRRLLREMR